MDFTFSEDQLAFQEAAKDFLVNEVTPEKIRGLWETDSGRSDELWTQLTELGLTGLTVPEEFGGLGMSELDFILIAQECGFVALPEPLVHEVLVAVPTLLALGNDALNQEWLPKIATGEAKVIVGIEANLLVEDAHIADLLLLQKDGAIYAVEPAKATLRYNESVDPSRKLYAVEFDMAAAECVADGEQAAAVAAAALNRGALGMAAQALGLAQRMIEISVQYTSERQQFGKPIGSFQAVKHHMSNIAYKLEYAKAPLHRAAYALVNGLDNVDSFVSHAKLAASEVADIAAKNSVQVHGAMGYTWEVDLHIYMKKGWACAHVWGDVAYHKQRMADFLFADGAPIGAGKTF